MLAEILEIIGVSIGVTAILIVVWDHFKDDRLLFRQVQEFYEDIERLMYTYCFIHESEKEPSIKHPIQKNNYYDCKVKQNFEKYSNYLGLTMLESDDFYYYYNPTNLYLRSDGVLYHDYGEDSDEVFNPYHISSEDVNVMEKYLKTLRNYWERNYSKPLFRPKLKKKIDFSILNDNKFSTK